MLKQTLMKQIRIFLFYSILIGTVNSSAQTVPAVLDSLLDQTLDSMRNAMGAKSLSAAIEFPDTSIWSHANGISSASPAIFVDTDDAYLIGSVTKTLTSACILQLVQDGIMNLDDSLYQWTDTIQYINPNITIRQLLRHQSGIYDVLSNPACQPALLADQDSIWSAEDLISTFIAPPVFQPGATWSYSNTNYFLLGMIIERATGNPFYVEIRNRFLSALGLNTIAIKAFEPLNSPVAHVWMDLNNDQILEDAHSFYFNYLSLNSVAGAAGGYYSTPSDITKWMRRYMRGDLLSPALMTEAKTTVAASGVPGGTYGLGLMKKSFIGYQGYGHGGDLAYAASSWYFPALDISISVLMNDASKNSWTLVPVITALLRTYNNYIATTSVNENTIDAIQSIFFPNPFSDNLNLKVELNKRMKNVQVTLTNILGEIVSKSSFDELNIGNHTIEFKNIEAIPDGIYFAEISSDGDLLQTKMLIRSGNHTR